MIEGMNDFSSGRVVLEVQGRIPAEVLGLILSPTSISTTSNGVRVSWMLPDIAENLPEELLNAYIDTLSNFLSLAANSGKVRVVDVI